MAEGGYDRIPEWDYDNTGEYPDDDDNADQTTPFFPNGASTPYQAHAQEEIEMKSFQEKRGRPGHSYVETSFGETKDLEKRLAILRRDSETDMLNTTKIPTVENPLSLEEKQIEIQRVRDFIKTRYPNADTTKLVISFSSSSKKQMDIVVKGPKGGETKIIKDDGSGFQKSFLNLTYVKKALGESFEQINEKEKRSLIEERRKLADLERKSPEKRTIIDALKEKISKKEEEKKEKKSFTEQNKQKKLKSEKRKLKNKMKKIKKS